MKVWYQNGIHLVLDDKHLLFDPVGNADIEAQAVFVSHGHADHAKGLKDMRGETIIMHPATMEYKDGSIDYSNEVKTYTEGDSFELLGLSVECFLSGHCLGGMQFKITGEEGIVVFTGDINISGNHIEAKAPILQCDTLIIEANFGHPKFVFPDRNLVYMDLAAWVKKYINIKPIVIFAHGLGKTQELTAVLGDMGLLNGADKSAKLYMSGNALRSNIIFEKYRFTFNYRFRSFTKSSVLMPGDILIHPIYERVSWDSISDIKKKLQLTECAVAHVSGWTLNGKGDYEFPLSSHSGFDELIKYIQESKAKKVYTFHGYAKTLAEYARSIEIDAENITRENGYL